MLLGEVDHTSLNCLHYPLFQHRLLTETGGADVEEWRAGLVSDTDLALLAIPVPKIGRASCRERVCYAV